MGTINCYPVQYRFGATSLNVLEDRTEDAMRVWARIPPTRDGLCRLRQRAIRFNLWFRLNWSERRYMHAVIRAVGVLRSPLLLRIVGAIVEKLLDVSRGLVWDARRMMETVGKPLAQRLTLIACSWGNKTAMGWAKELKFIRYLTIMQMNDPRAIA